MVNLPVYLDNNATTPCDPRVADAIWPFFTRYFGNAGSRDHAYGWEALAAVDIAREQLAGLINAHPHEIVFTSGATESVNLALKGVLEAYRSKGNHIITVATEHKAVLDTCAHLEKNGARISYLPVDQHGLVDPNLVAASIEPATVLICVMHANNETGVLQPVEAIGQLAKDRNVLFFCDAVQSVGKTPVDVQALNADLLSISAHKMYGPKGIGALFVRRRDPRVSLMAQMDGGAQEKGRRSGTLNVPGIVGLGKAAALALQEMETDRTRTAALMQKLEKALQQQAGAVVNGSLQHRLSHVSNCRFEGISSSSLIAAIGKEIAVSTGSACTSGTTEPSHVLLAMGLTEAAARSSIRFSAGRFTTEAEIDHVIEVLLRAINTIRKQEQGQPITAHS
ncbi:MAG: IscS subfamily cysteine desulfurase [Bacteroidota bacterium]|nr:IscS subfamily cysteine desulfurase [Bacteroidota bacterium]